MGGFLQAEAYQTLALYPGSTGQGKKKKRAWYTPLAHALNYNVCYRVAVRNDVKREMGVWHMTTLPCTFNIILAPGLRTMAAYCRSHRPTPETPNLIEHK